MNDNNDIPAWNPSDFPEMDERMAQLKDMRKNCPVVYTERGGGGWGFLKYQDIVDAAMDPDTYRNGGAPRFGRPAAPLEVDPPVHREYRRLLTPFFTGKNIKALENSVQQFARDLVEPMLERGHADLAREYSYPLPVLSLCALLGFGADRWDEIKKASEESLSVESDNPKERQMSHDAHETLLGLTRELVADRRAGPRDPDTDLPSAILNATIAGNRISDEDACSMMRLLISAGHNSTTSGLGNALLYLARYTDAQQHLRENPDAIPAAIEEILRFDTPVQVMPRRAGKQLNLYGQVVEPGERIDMFWASGNRDEDIFENPDQCILDRHPNKHLAFGYGIHLCIGAPMARMEIRVALEEALDKTRLFEVDGEVVRTPFHRVGVSRLPVKFSVL